MSDEDKIMGVVDGTVIYSSFRIDYDSEEDIRFDEDGNERFTGSVKSPRPGHPDHPVKDGFRRKVVVADAATRDEVISYLDDNDIPRSQPEDVSPTQTEKDAIEEWGAKDGSEGVEALKWKDALDNTSTVNDMIEIEKGKHPSTGEKITRPIDKKESVR